MHFVDFVLRNLLRRRVRTALTVVGVSVAIAAVVALMSITGGYQRSAQNVYASHGVDLVVVRAGVADVSTSTLSESLGKRLEKLPDVGKVAPALSYAVSFEKGSLQSRNVNGWPIDSFAFDALTVLPPGRYLESTDSKTCMIGKSLAKELDKKLG
ncbi:MAG TPA: ABC transporter permease, partial [Pirellulales bacterium]